MIAMYQLLMYISKSTKFCVKQFCYEVENLVQRKESSIKSYQTDEINANCYDSTKWKSQFGNISSFRSKHCNGD